MPMAVCKALRLYEQDCSIREGDRGCTGYGSRQEGIGDGKGSQGNRHRILRGLILRPTGREPVRGDHGRVR
jgi:hypothetical protein